jgi:hypothetical protein
MAPPGLLGPALLLACEGIPPSHAPIPDEPEHRAPTGDGPVRERFPVGFTERVDWLMVVDDAPGSGSIQHEVVASFPVLVDVLAGAEADWRIGVVAADPDAPDVGALRPVGAAAWADASTELVDLAAALGVGEAGGRASATLAITAALQASANGAFFRDDALLRLIVVGSGDDDATPAELPAAAFDQWLASTRPDATVSCVVTAPGGGDCGARAAVSGGVVTHPDALDVVAVHASGLRQDFVLSDWPDEDTLAVSVEDGSGAHLVLGPGDWSWSPVDNVVSFLEYVPSQGAVVVVEYFPAR